MDLGYGLLKSKNVFPDDHKYLTFLKKVFRHEFRKNGFRRISTPHFGEKKYFDNIFGSKTSENTFTFTSFDNTFCLNPLPSIFNLKAYIEEDNDSDIKPIYSYFMSTFYPFNSDNIISGEMFFGGDVIGENDVIIDIQNLFIVSNVLNKIGLKGKYDIYLNFTGTKKEIDKYKEKLSEFYEDKKHLLTPEGLKNLENGDVLKLLSSLDEDEQILAETAPKIEKFYKKDSKKDIVNIKEYLDILSIDYTYDTKLFGNYHFNDGVIWNIKLKGENVNLANGYGYNQLSNLVGEAKEIPGSGFCVDTFKIIDLLKTESISIINKDKLDLFFVQLGDDAKKVVMPLSLQAREAGINTEVSLGTPSMKEQMLKANRSGAKYVVIVGFMEAKNGIFQVRNNKLGTQEEVKKEHLIEYIIDKIGKNCLDFYDPSIDLLEK